MAYPTKEQQAKLSALEADYMQAPHKKYIELTSAPEGDLIAEWRYYADPADMHYTYTIARIESDGELSTYEMY